MTARRRDEDRRAVDLLLDRASVGSGANPTVAGNGNGKGNGNSHGNGHSPARFTPVSGDVQQRLPAVQNILQMLDMLRADEPPQDLLARTLRRLDSEMANHPSALRAPQPALGSEMQQPHA